MFAPELKLDDEVLSEKTYNSGDLYLRLHDEYHNVEAEHGTVTKVMKHGKSYNAYVIAPRENEKEVHVPELACWRLIEEVLNV